MGVGRQHAHGARLQGGFELVANLLRHGQHVPGGQRGRKQGLDLIGKVVESSASPVGNLEATLSGVAAEKRREQEDGLEGADDILEEFLHLVQDLDEGRRHGHRRTQGEGKTKAVTAGAVNCLKLTGLVRMHRSMDRLKKKTTTTMFKEGRKGRGEKKKGREQSSSM